MKHLACIALIACLAVVLGCTPEPPAPADQPESSTRADEPIVQEDFESGTTENMIEGTDEDIDATEETDDSGDNTP